MYVWSSRIAEYGLTKQGCQSCLWSAEQGKLLFPCPRSRQRIWSHETDSVVPSHLNRHILQTQPRNVEMKKQKNPITAIKSGVVSIKLTVTRVRSVTIIRKVVSRKAVPIFDGKTTENMTLSVRTALPTVHRLQ